MFTQVSAGTLHTCGILEAGAIVCWGLNDDGQASPPGGTFAQVSAGVLHTCGLQTNGTVDCWGFDYYGQSSPPIICK
jgi:alpha-tubulin suppressor-like RCC1 family protein